MGKGKTRGNRSLGLMVLVVIVLLLAGMCEIKIIASAELSDAQCKEERRIGLNDCKAVLYGKLPTPACCERARVSHIECVCPVITPKLAALIDVNRAIRLIEGCGRRVPRHFKCGSKLPLSLSLSLNLLHHQCLILLYSFFCLYQLFLLLPFSIL